MPKVTMISPTRQKPEIKPVAKLRVGAYCRVSSNHDEQQQSFSAQVEHYTGLIEENPDWKFSGIYADEGISGTSKFKRNEFLRLMKDCEARKLDMVITKSISRFARNTKDCIEAIRRLKELNIAIYFEKENINTLKVDSELIITILGSTAQEESLSISKNNKWAIQKRFQNGEWNPSYLPYGYTKDEDGEIIINETEAAVIRRIFDEYLNGKGSYIIARELTQDGVPTRKGAGEWSENVVNDILINEKYVGDLLMQKTYTTDTLPFIRKKNTGQKRQYFIKDNHEPIISREYAEKAIEILNQRKKEKKMLSEPKKYNNRYHFSGKIICGECGTYFKRQKLFKGKPYQTEQWGCSRHIKNKAQCSMTAIKEEHIRNAFIQMYNKLKTNCEPILIPLVEYLKKLHYSNEYEAQIKQINHQIAELMEQSHVLSRLRSKGYLDSVLFIEKNNRLVQETAELKEQRARLMDYTDFDNDISKTNELIRMLKKREDILEEFDEAAFLLTVEKIIVKSKVELAFCLVNGLELTEFIGEDVK